MRDYVDNSLLRAAVLESGMPYAEICRRSGFLKKVSPSKRHRSDSDTFPDTTQLQRKLGIKPSKSGEKFSYNKNISYKEAVRICRAIDAWPVEVGV